MRRWIGSRFIVWLYATTLPMFAAATTVDVCPTCKTSDPLIAITEAAPRDTVLVHPGEYRVENILIKVPLVLIGKPGAKLISKTGDELLTVLADSVTVRGLTLCGVTTSYLKERSAIRLTECKDYQISANTIIDCFFGIYLERSHRGLVINNQIKGNATITEAESGNGIHAWHCKLLTISGNWISGHRDGIYFEFVTESQVSENHAENNNRYGLHFMFSNDDTYTNNHFRDNGVGVAVMFSRRIEMRGNTFSHNWGRASYGLLLKEIFDAEIRGNTFLQNTIGIFVEGSNRINYRSNNFIRNGWAIKFSGGCEDNDINHNNFINNSMDLVMNAKLSSNQFHHNYWSNYAGYDLDKDGIGDIPYYPVKLFSYILDQVPEGIVLMRSLFIDLINFSEKVSPIFTPKELKDQFPLMNKIG